MNPTLVISIATVAIAGVVAFVTRQVNRSKLRLDLYNRRFDIYSKTLDFFQMVLYFDPSKADLSERAKYDLLEKGFIKAQRESQFLFKRESKGSVFQLLEEFQQKARSMVTHRELRQTMLSSDSEEGRTASFTEYSNNAKWVRDDFIRLLENALSPYLDFQRIAGIW